jgi:hypothetical protein
MLISSFPYVETATPEEITEGERLQAEFDRFDAQLKTVNPTELIEKFRAVRAAYMESPTDENFETVKRVSFEKRFFRAEDDARQIARAARAHFIETQIVPWALVLLKRALEKARANLKKVTEEEDSRHRKLTGAPLTVSGIVDEAKRPVRHLESLLMDAPENPRSFRVENILRLFRGDGPLVGGHASMSDRGRADNPDPRRPVQGFKLLPAPSVDSTDAAFAEGLDGDDGGEGGEGEAEFADMNAAGATTEAGASE